MTDVGWRKAGAWGGIAFVVLQIAGQILVQVGGMEPEFGADATEILEFFAARDPGLVSAGGFLSMLGMLALLWFLGGFWATLGEAEGDPAWMSTVALVSGAVAVAVSSATASGWGLAVFRVDEGLDPAMARMLFDLGNFGFALFWLFLAGFLLATAFVVLRKGGLPRWLGWLAVLTAVALLVAHYFWASPSGAIFLPYVLFWVWLIATSVVLLRRPAVPPVPRSP